MADSSLNYWFRVLDYDNDGYIGKYDIEHFYLAKRRQLNADDASEDAWVMDTVDTITQLTDLVNPRVPGKISSMDIRRSASGEIVFDILLSLSESRAARNYL